MMLPNTALPEPVADATGRFAIVVHVASKRGLNFQPCPDINL